MGHRFPESGQVHLPLDRASVDYHFFRGSGGYLESIGFLFRRMDLYLQTLGLGVCWHMNKAHWLSVALDGTVDDEKDKFLVMN